MDKYRQITDKHGLFFYIRGVVVVKTKQVTTIDPMTLSACIIHEGFINDFRTDFSRGFTDP